MRVVAADRSSAADTSALVAAHIWEHELREVAAPVVASATHVVGQVLTEAWSVLRRVYRLPVDHVADALWSYREDRELVVATPDVYDQVLRTGRATALAGNVHDAVIVRTAEQAGLRLVTCDRGMANLANGVVSCEYLTPS